MTGETKVILMAAEPVPCLLWDIANDLSKVVFGFGPKYF